MPAIAEALVLAPISQLPVSAILLNTGQELQAVVEVMPVYWKYGKPLLTIKGLPRDLLGGKTLVIKLEFAEPIDDVEQAVVIEFKG